MSHFVEYPRFVNLYVADVEEVDAAHLAELADDVGNVVLAVGAEGARADGEAVARAVYHGGDLVEVRFVLYDAGQAEYGNGGIVGMDAHLDAHFFSHGDDGFEEVFQVLAQAVFVHAFVRFKQAGQLFQPFRFPAGEDIAVAVFQDFFYHVLRRLAGYHVVVVSQDRRAVVEGLGQLRAGPVEDGHEIVAYHFDAGLCGVAQGLDVVFDVLVAAGKAELDVFVDVDAFQILEYEVVRFGLLLNMKQRLYRPHFADGNVEQCADDAVHAGDLVDLLQCNLVVFFSVPTEGHSHAHTGLLLLHMC